MFTKAVSADAWSVIFWRGLSGIVFSVIFLALRAKVRDEMRRFGWPALFAALIGASGTAAFIPAFKLTSVANVSLIWATAPFLAALLAWITIKERPSRLVIVCSVFALIGVAITVSGSFGSASLLGD
ncbi:MAG: EamA family transporter, partial [Planktotalea sp.]